VPRAGGARGAAGTSGSGGTRGPGRRVCRGRAPAPRMGPRPVAVAIGALAAGLAIAGTLAAAPGVRARIADWLGIGAERIERVERLPDVGPGRDVGLGRRTTLAGARRSAGVPVPAIAALGAPDAVYAARSGSRGASLVYLAR